MNVSEPSFLPAHRLTATGKAAERPAQPVVERGEGSPPAKGRTSLWEILTPEERAFFQKETTLTYRPGGGRPEPKPGPLGHNVDVRG
jgi:hypothetical protein